MRLRVASTVHKTLKQKTILEVGHKNIKSAMKHRFFFICCGFSGQTSLLASGAQQRMRKNDGSESSVDPISGIV